MVLVTTTYTTYIVLRPGRWKLKVRQSKYVNAKSVLLSWNGKTWSARIYENEHFGKFRCNWVLANVYLCRYAASYYLCRFSGYIPMCMLLLLYGASKDLKTIANHKHKNNNWIMRYFSFNISQVRFTFIFSNSGLLKIRSIPHLTTSDIWIVKMSCQLMTSLWLNFAYFRFSL